MRLFSVGWGGDAGVVICLGLDHFFRVEWRESSPSQGLNSLLATRYSFLIILPGHQGAAEGGPHVAGGVFQAMWRLTGQR